MVCAQGCADGRKGWSGNVRVHRYGSALTCPPSPLFPLDSNDRPLPPAHVIFAAFAVVAPGAL